MRRRRNWRPRRTAAERYRARLRWYERVAGHLATLGELAAVHARL